MNVESLVEKSNEKAAILGLIEEKGTGSFMSDIIRLDRAKSANVKELVESLKILSRMVYEAIESDLEFSEEDIMKEIIGSDAIYRDPRKITDPIIINEGVVAIPSIAPNMDYTNNKKSRGRYVIPLMKIPGSPFYYSFNPLSETFLDHKNFSLGINRSVSLHRIVPGMIIAFYHYEADSSGSSKRNKIEARKIVYGEDNYPEIQEIDESEAICFDMPAIDKNNF